MSGKYDDIIGLPHHQSATRRRMSMTERAAQFSPFAALTGYGAEIAEARRVTERRPTLARDARERLDRRLALLLAALPDRPAVRVGWFVPDRRKEGGAMRISEGKVKKLNSDKTRLLMENGDSIPLADVVTLDGDLFGEM